MPELEVEALLRTLTVTVREVRCAGTCQHKGPEGVRPRQLVFPYRGVYVRHLGSDPAVAEANQVVIFNPGEGYRISYPVKAATRAWSSPTRPLRELVPASLQRRGVLRSSLITPDRSAPRRHVALLRHGPRPGAAGARGRTPA